MLRFWVHGILFLLALVSLLPLWIMFVTSFKASYNILGLGSIFPIQGGWTVQNFVDVWLTGNFGRYFLNSLIVTTSITCANIVFDSMAAYALARRKFWGKTLIMLLILSKLMIPAAVLMVPTFILIRQLGLYDSYLALILPLVAETFGIFVIRQYMLSLAPQLEEAARLEGASDWKVFWTIVLPQCKPVLSVVVIHSVMTSWNMYIYPLLLTSSDSMRTLPLGIAFFQASNSGVDSGHLMAGAVIAALPVILVFLFFQSKILSSLGQGAVKG